MTDGLALVLLTLLAAWLVWWLFLTPARPPRPRRRRLEGIGWSACALASCIDGVRLTVDTEWGVHLCDFEKRPDTGRIQQDLLLHVARPDAPDIAERIVDGLRAAGFGTATPPFRDDANQPDQLDIQVPLFGRREELGFQAIAALRAIAAARSLPSGTIYVFQQHGFPDRRLIWRFAEEGDQSVETKRKLQELTELARQAAA